MELPRDNLSLCQHDALGEWREPALEVPVATSHLASWPQGPSASSPALQSPARHPDQVHPPSRPPGRLAC